MPELNEQDDHTVAEYIRAGAVSSQADVMRDEARMPSMYEASIAAGGLVADINHPARFSCGGTHPGKVEDCTMGCNVSAATAAAVEILKRPAVYMEHCAKDVVHLEILNIPNEQALKIVKDLLPDMLELFLRKNAEYGVDELSLGPRAEFVRLWNKMRKLKTALWDGEELEFEQAGEILDDFLGHILLARFGLTE